SLPISLFPQLQIFITRLKVQYSKIFIKLAAAEVFNSSLHLFPSTSSSSSLTALDERVRNLTSNDFWATFHLHPLSISSSTTFFHQLQNPSSSSRPILALFGFPSSTTSHHLDF